MKNPNVHGRTTALVAGPRLFRDGTVDLRQPTPFVFGVKLGHGETTSICPRGNEAAHRLIHKDTVGMADGSPPEGRLAALSRSRRCGCKDMANGRGVLANAIAAGAMAGQQLDYRIG